MSKKDIKDEYIEISTILSKESNRGNLIEIDSNFYERLRDLINELERLLDEERKRQPYKRQKRLNDQLHNLITKSEEFYRYRVKKIFLLVYKSENPRDIKRQGLAKEEMEMLNEFIKVLGHYSYLVNFTRADEDIQQEIEKEIVDEGRREKEEELPERREEDRKPDALSGQKEEIETEKTAMAEKEEIEATKSDAEDIQKERKEESIKELPMTDKGVFSEELPEKTALVRALEDLKEIAWMETNYRIRQEDICVLPEIIARVLLKNGQVELIAYNL